MPLKVYGQPQGLQDLNANCMLQDHNGYLWVGTEDGLYRYDGKHFQQFTKKDGLADSNVTTLIQDADDTIWIGTGAGLSILRHGHFDTLPDSRINGGLRVNSSIALWKNGVVFVSRQTLWYARNNETTSGTDRAKWSLSPIAREHIGIGKARSVFRDRSGRLWIGCDDGICQISGAEQSTWSQLSGVPKDRWVRFFQAKDGGLWARGIHHIVYLPPGSNKFEDRTASVGSRLFMNASSSMLEDPSGRLLIAAQGGMLQWNANHWEEVKTFDRQNRKKLSPLLLDNEGNFWLKEAGHGILRALGYNHWQSWTEEEGITEGLVFGVLRDRQNRLWVAAQDGLFMSSPPYTEFRQIAPELRAGKRLVAVTEASDGSIWAASESGVILRVNPVTLHVRVIPVGADLSLQDLTEGPDGDLWIATTTGLTLLKKSGAGITTETVTDRAAPHEEILQFAHDTNGDLLSLTYNKLYRYSEHQWSSITLPPDLTKLDLDTIAVANDHDIWLGGEDAVVRIECQGNAIKDIRIFSSPEVSTHLVSFVGADPQGGVWVGGDHAVAHYNGSNWRAYTTEDGLIWNDTDRHAFFADKDGGIWIGTTDGISHFQPSFDSQIKNSLPAPVLEASLGTKAVNPVGFSIFPWNNRSLTATFSALTYTHEPAISFVYRLAGLEDTWVTNTDGQIRYSSLPAGSYVLEAYTIDDELHLASPITSLPFVIRAPWWRQWPAETAAVLLASGLLFLLVRCWVRYLLQRKLLEEQATRDGLTKLWNRTTGMEILRREMSRAQRSRAPMLLAMLDIDYFKHINDSYGHLAGDVVIREIASRLQFCVREHDSVARYGGEEFMLIMSGISEDSAIQRISEIHKIIGRTPLIFGDNAIHVTCSIGALYTTVTPKDRPDILLNQADQLLYAAKRSGRNRIEFSRLLPETNSDVFGTHAASNLPKEETHPADSLISL